MINTIVLDEIKTITMPDGLLHFLAGKDKFYLNDTPHIVARLRDGNDLLKLAQVVDILRNTKDLTQTQQITLDIVYLSAMRMDRRITSNDGIGPASLKIFVDFINSLRIDVVRLHCPHSEVTEALINNSFVSGSDIIFYLQALSFFSSGHSSVHDDSEPISIVLPDSGMVKKFYNRYLSNPQGYRYLVNDNNIVEASKKRDMATGKLSGFKVVDGKPYKRCLIIDDLCDGGGTFVGLSKVLKEEYNVKEIGLAAFHGIFSKGLPLEYIDWIYTTDSFQSSDKLRTQTDRVIVKGIVNEH